MLRTWLVAGCLMAILGLTASALAAAPTRTETAKPDREARKIVAGSWQPPLGLKQVPIWPNAAPNKDDASHKPESVLTAQTPEALDGPTSQAVFDVSSPTMTVFPPKGGNTHSAVIVFPGGGFRAVVVTLEGTEICSWLTSRGITCIVSKYRVPGTNDYWNEKCNCRITPKVPRALQDAQRTIRLVRSQAEKLHVDPHKIGVMGFSAGGYLVVQTSNIFEPAYKPIDDIDRVSSRPDFAIALYPGHLCRPGKVLDPTINVTKRTPPTFLLQAWDDPVDEICNSTLYARALDEAGVSAEVHLFAKGGHAFALRHKDQSVGIWPSLVETWLKSLGIL